MELRLAETNHCHIMQNSPLCTYITCALVIEVVSDLEWGTETTGFLVTLTRHSCVVLIRKNCESFI